KQRQAEEQRTIEARIHAEQEELMRQAKERNARETSAAAADAAADVAAAAATASPSLAGTGTPEGGEEGPATKSTASSGLSSLPARASFATVAERRLTEEQIRNQHVPGTTSSFSSSFGGGGAMGPSSGGRSSTSIPPAGGARGGGSGGSGSFLDHALAESTAV
ncbi:unnamed protein product, partial [Hapterophycus canaliculatus]